jgi:hypothetical protein
VLELGPVAGAHGGLRHVDATFPPRQVVQQFDAQFVDDGLHARVARQAASQRGRRHDRHIGEAGVEQARHAEHIGLDEYAALGRQVLHQRLVSLPIVETAHQRHS